MQTVVVTLSGGPVSALSLVVAKQQLSTARAFHAEHGKSGVHAAHQVAEALDARMCCRPGIASQRIHRPATYVMQAAVARPWDGDLFIQSGTHRSRSAHCTYLEGIYSNPIRRVLVHAPFEGKSLEDVLRFAYKWKGELAETRDRVLERSKSCEVYAPGMSSLQDHPICGACEDCEERAAAFKAIGQSDPGQSNDKS